MSKSVVEHEMEVQEQRRTEKQKKKEEEKRKRYLNTMVTRKEVLDLVEELNFNNDLLREQLQLAHIQIRTFTRLAIDKKWTTEEELNEISKEILDSIYNTKEDDKEDTDEQ